MRISLNRDELRKYNSKIGLIRLGLTGRLINVGFRFIKDEVGLTSDKLELIGHKQKNLPMIRTGSFMTGLDTGYTDSCILFSTNLLHWSLVPM